MARVIVFRGRNKERSYNLTSRRTVIGRGKDADIRVDNPLVSRAHALLIFKDGHWVVEDLDSPNGLYLNGERTKSSRLEVGDRIELGRHVLIFEGSGESEFDVDTQRSSPLAEGSSSEATAILRTKEIKNIHERIRQRMGRHLAIVWDGQRKEIPLTEQHYVVGWDDTCTIRLPGKVLFGKKAAELKRSGDTYTITPLSGLNKIRVNGAKLSLRQLEDGDRIQIRSVTLEFHLRIGSKKGED